jgi:hypothetical protein
VGGGWWLAAGRWRSCAPGEAGEGRGGFEGAGGGGAKCRFGRIPPLPALAAMPRGLKAQVVTFRLLIRIPHETAIDAWTLSWYIESWCSFQGS